YSFAHLFRKKFSTTKQKATWQKQLFEIKQGTDTVDTYISRFKRLKARVDPTDAFPEAVMVQFFIQGLRPEYAMNVQAAEPAELDNAITEARKWKTGRIMASAHNANDANQAIEHLTEQIAKLSINLAEKQAAPPTPTPAYYTDQSKDRSQPNVGNATCYYCGQKGHFIRNCHTRYQDNKRDYQGYQSRGRSNNYSSRHNQSYDRSRSRNRSQSHDRNYNRSRYNRSRSRSQSRDRYRNNRNYRSSDRSRSRNRSSTPYPRDVYTLNTANDYTYEQFEAFLT